MTKLQKLTIDYNKALNKWKTTPTRSMTNLKRLQYCEMRLVTARILST